MKKGNSRKGFQAVLLPFAALLVLSICSTNECYAQSQVACEISKMNVVYVGFDNPIIIAASEYSVNDLELSVTNGQINGLAGKYLLRPGKAGIVELTVKADGKVLEKKTLRALLAPDPHAGIVMKIGDYKKLLSAGKISKKQLLEIDEIAAQSVDFLFDVEYKVVGFSVIATGGGGINIIEKSDSNRITEQQSKLFKTMRIGQEIFIEDIKAIGPDGLVRDLNSIEFEVL